jgi:hypothetical protein
MSNLKINKEFTRKSDPKLETFSNQVSTSMTGNPVFPDPVPTLPEIATLITDFTTALNESKDGDRLKIAIKNQKRKALIDGLILLANYVLFQSAGSKVDAISSGFKVSKSPSPLPPIVKPEDFRINYGSNPGELILRVKRQRGVVTYLFQYATDEEMALGMWKGIPCSKSTCTITGLTASVKYNLRVAAVGSKEQLMYSDIISRIAS